MSNVLNSVNKRNDVMDLIYGDYSRGLEQLHKKLWQMKKKVWFEVLWESWYQSWTGVYD